MNQEGNEPTFAGLMFIGDPHLDARVPGLRKDDYPQVALKKFRWCIEYAAANDLQPILLGDLFQLPQDNPNWLLSEIIDAILTPLPAIYGNHDVRENSLKQNDSINVLFSGGHLRRISLDDPLRVQIDGKSVAVAGIAWGEKFPRSDNSSLTADLNVWITHHDILIPGYEEGGRIRPKPVSGVDLIVNGHIHRRLDPVSKQGTHWITAGNITRRARNDASREHIPAVPCLYPAIAPTATDAPVFQFLFRSQAGDKWRLDWLTVPHEPFDDIFHQDVQADDEAGDQSSGFVADLRQLTARKTDSGAGLTEFLKQHVEQFDPPVAKEIMRLHDLVADPEHPATSES